MKVFVGVSQPGRESSPAIRLNAAWCSRAVSAHRNGVLDEGPRRRRLSNQQTSILPCESLLSVSIRSGPQHRADILFCRKGTGCPRLVCCKAAASKPGILLRISILIVHRMMHDKKIIGVCGETSIANAKQSIVTMAQVG
jgi:hypothetical protein